MAKQRKGLMSLLTEYQNEKYYGKAGQRGMTRDGDSKADIAEARKRQAEVKADKPQPRRSSSSSGSRSSSSGSRSSSSRSSSSGSRSSSSTPSVSRTLYSGGNVGSGRDGRPGTGTRGQSMPSNPPGMRQTRAGDKPTRRSGTGRTGYAAQRRAMRPKKEEPKKMTAAERRQMRLRARRGR